MNKKELVKEIYENPYYFDLITTAEDAMDVHYTIRRIVEKIIDLDMLKEEYKDE